ncbi:DUF3038 domain-containing protein [Phormidium yuhuli AB48]|uniref:DUF3038 domain-containing protein n=1 Tax=Phormidium yuhuli AB48 TaxID=2940671 RepID=A0ABY5ASY6_9CYAN|nr:DUF3038 domain-containing protein [Phormidium yuhuli]USR92342.1 DUF3038 domain-containing protein [Phormidium yuhuli AB48]
MVSNPLETHDSTLLLRQQQLPDMPVTHHGCSRRTRVQLDLMLLAIEALDLSGSEKILSLARQLELNSVLSDRVTVWRIRNTNPLRRASRRRPLSQEEAKVLTIIICYLARSMTIPLRQLNKEAQQLREQHLPLDKNPQLAFYLSRFRAHFRSRMNPRRSAVMVYDTDEKLDNLAVELLEKLLFCTGTAGLTRFWVSLFDGEI